MWLDRVEGKPVGTAVWPEVDAAGWAELAETARRRWAAFLDGLTADRLRETVSYATSAGARFETRVDDILLHVALHGSYHRGQVAALLRGAGAAPEATDYILFVRGNPPGGPR